MHLPGTLRIVATVAFALMSVAPASAQQPTRPATAPAGGPPPPTTAASTPPLQDTVRITLPEASAGLLARLEAEVASLQKETWRCSATCFHFS